MANIFKTDSAPYILVLIVSALGWYVAELNEGLRNSKTANYSILQYQPGKAAAVTFENLSRADPLRSLVVNIFCEGDPAPGITARNSSSIQFYLPHRPLENVRVADDSGPLQEVYRLGLPPGASVTVKAILPACQSPLQVSFRQGTETQFYLVSSSSIEGIVARSYTVIMVIGFILLSVVLIIWITVNIYSLKRERGNADKDSDPQRIDVSLKLVD